MITPKRQFGDWGENVALKYLREKGYQILERNFRKKWGEIDLVVLKTKGKILPKGESLVFVEVKTALNPYAFLASQNVHFKKQRRLINAARSYLKEKKISPEMPWQIDVLTVGYDQATGLCQVNHIENAVWDNRAYRRRY